VSAADSSLTTVETSSAPTSSMGVVVGALLGFEVPALTAVAEISAHSRPAAASVFHVRNSVFSTFLVAGSSAIASRTGP